MTGFEELVVCYKDHLIYFIERYVKSYCVAEELAQDAFVEVYLHPERFRKSQNFKTYLFTIGRNKAVDFIRKNSRLVFTEELPEDPADQKTLEEKLIQKEEIRALYRAVWRLKPDYQAAIVSIDLEGMSYQETAEVFGKSIAQVKILIHRARKALAKQLKREENIGEE